MAARSGQARDRDRGKDVVRGMARVRDLARAVVIDDTGEMRD
jgi:hypothetical protein